MHNLEFSQNFLFRAESQGLQKKCLLSYHSRLITLMAISFFLQMHSVFAVAYPLEPSLICFFCYKITQR